MRIRLGKGLLLGVAGAAYAAWCRSFRVDPIADSVYYATTADGWRIALSRYGQRPTRRHPVVLCHGLSANRVGFDLAPEVSLARRLSRSGWDVWCLELRGHGLSDRPDIFAGRSYGWSFDDYLHFDLPAALDLITNETGRDQVLWLGHSMGGALLYAHLASSKAPRVKAGIAVGSSLDYSQTESDFHGLAHLLPLTRVLPSIPFGPLARAAAPLSGRFPNRLEEFNVWPPNVDPELARKLNASAFHPVSSPVLAQLATAMQPGGLRSEDGRTRYMDGLPKSRVPVLALAGDRDRQCPLDAARLPLEALGAETRLEAFGKEHGHLEHYGHFDLLIGKHAAVETVPVIESWLEEHD